MTDNFGMGVEGSSCDIIKVTSQYFHGGTEENHRKPQVG
jgi:hypothetical protein